MPKLVISHTVELDDATFVALCMRCQGYLRIPGTDLTMLPESAADVLKEIITTGVQVEKPALRTHLPAVPKTDCYNPDIGALIIAPNKVSPEAESTYFGVPVPASKLKYSVPDTISPTVPADTPILTESELLEGVQFRPETKPHEGSGEPEVNPLEELMGPVNPLDEENPADQQYRIPNINTGPTPVVSPANLRRAGFLGGSRGLRSQ